MNGPTIGLFCAFRELILQYPSHIEDIEEQAFCSKSYNRSPGHQVIAKAYDRISWYQSLFFTFPCELYIVNCFSLLPIFFDRLPPHGIKSRAMGG
jgi:hypothetical protein